MGALWISYLYHWLKHWSRLNSKHCLKKTQNTVSSNIHTRLHLMAKRRGGLFFFSRVFSLRFWRTFGAWQRRWRSRWGNSSPTSRTCRCLTRCSFFTERRWCGVVRRRCSIRRRRCSVAMGASVVLYKGAGALVGTDVKTLRYCNALGGWDAHFPPKHVTTRVRWWAPVHSRMGRVPVYARMPLLLKLSAFCWTGVHRCVGVRCYGAGVGLNNE